MNQCPPLRQPANFVVITSRRWSASKLSHKSLKHLAFVSLFFRKLTVLIYAERTSCKQEGKFFVAKFSLCKKLCIDLASTALSFIFLTTPLLDPVIDAWPSVQMPTHLFHFFWSFMIYVYFIFQISFLNFERLRITPERRRGTLGFRGTPFQKHCLKAYLNVSFN